MKSAVMPLLLTGLSLAAAQEASDDQKNFNQAGLPTMSAIFGAVTAVAFIYLIIKTPSTSVPNVPNYALLGLQAGLFFMSGIGSAFVVSPYSHTGFVMALIPFPGFWGLKKGDPAFMVLFSAVGIYLLPSVLQILGGVQNQIESEGCGAQLENADLCEEGWIVFLHILGTIYLWLLAVEIFACFYCFNEMMLKGTNARSAGHQTEYTDNPISQKVDLS